MTGKRKYFRKQRVHNTEKQVWTPATTRTAIISWAQQNNVDPAVLGSAVWSLSIDLARAAKVPLEDVLTLVRDAWGKLDA